MVVVLKKGLLSWHCMQGSVDEKSWSKIWMWTKHCRTFPYFLGPIFIALVFWTHFQPADNLQADFSLCRWRQASIFEWFHQNHSKVSNIFWYQSSKKFASRQFKEIICRLWDIQHSKLNGDYNTLCKGNHFWIDFFASKSYVQRYHVTYITTDLIFYI